MSACSREEAVDGSSQPSQQASVDYTQIRKHLLDDSDGADWPAFGRTYGEQHFSPLTQINASNIGQLKLAWSFEIDRGTTVTGPLAVDGVVYVTTGYSVIRAIEATSGRELWVFDPKAAERAGVRLRQGWGNRGIAYWNGKIYTGTQDGRLIALDAKTGKELWSVMTLVPGEGTFVSGPPRVFDGKVAIGFGGADVSPVRGYVTTYDAETGKQLWRFWTVPGNPADGFENDAMAMAAKTWHGEWWKYGGGGTVWNAMTYDPETKTLFIGTGNGAPWNRKIRSAGKGDNLFLCSIVALDAETGKYKWHYQVNPGESWDYNAAMDMPLATLMIDGKPRKVLMQAPKNGFFYVIDRTTGKLISAEPFAKVNWASKIDLVTGRPVENPGIRYENGPVTMWPGAQGAHNWLPPSYNPGTGLFYMQVYDIPFHYDDSAIDLKNWKRTPGMANDPGVIATIPFDEPGTGNGRLIAWNPVTQKLAWQVPMEVFWNGGTMTTAGGLLFHGRATGYFDAYDAKSGKRLWSFDAKSAVMSPPITYLANGKQYVTVLSGFGASGALFSPALTKLGWTARGQARRVLTFVLNGKAELPRTPPPERVAPIPDPDFKPDPAAFGRGEITFGYRCVVCHGLNAVSKGLAPDLRGSAVIQSPDAFKSIVHDGAIVALGMPKFDNLTDRDLDDIRQYLRTRGRDLAAGRD